MQYRQGDVFIESVAALPAAEHLTAVPRDAGRVILAYGEVTGHAHALTADQVALFRDLRDASTWLVIRDVPAPLLHEEHAPIALPPGLYRIQRQREYTPEAVRFVAD